MKTRLEEEPEALTGYVAVQTPPVVSKNDFLDEPSQPTAEAAKAERKLVPFTELFTYADASDKWLMLAGTLGAIAAGAAQPMQMLLLGHTLNAFNPTDPNQDAAEMRHNINHAALNFVYVGAAVLVGGFLQVACWSVTASRQAKRIRGGYVSAIISKEIGWFDVNDPMQLPTRVADSSVTIQSGMGRKVGDALHFTAMAVSGLTIALVKGWQLALVLMAMTPFIAVAGYMATTALSTATQSGIDSYGQAGAIAQEALSNIRTVHMFNAIDHFIAKYDTALQSTTRAGIRKGLAVGWGTGLMFFAVFCTYAVGMFFGALKVANDHLDGRTCTGSNCYDGGRVLTVFFSTIFGAMAMGQAAPSVQAIFSARAAAFDVFALIKRQSLIDPLANAGMILPSVAGRINIDSVSFAYPSRPDVLVCKNYSLAIEAGETVALVGASGSGKSTVVSLLERFYDPLSGSVQLDGTDIRRLNVQWLRQQIGLVGQEPALFSATVLENIRHGAPGASDEDVFAAARMANAHDFITEFPQGYDTQVGERGAQLSGGQKQRIAIARAIIKNPAILLLDEATSALDTESERVVQESLDTLLATSKRTTIIVAHRLSTIRNASRIAVHQDGSIVEIGSHDELMQIVNGHYRALVQAQDRPGDDNTDSTTTRTLLTRRSSSFVSDKTGPSAKLAFIEQDQEVATEDSDSEYAKAPSISVSRIWRMSLHEWKFMLMGAFGAIMNAAVFPVWGVLLVKVTVLFFEYDKTKHEMMTDARYWSFGFLGLGVTFGLSIMLQHYGFAVTGQRLVARVRLATFRAMLRQEIGWFDLDENSSGALVSRLATDSATLQAMTSEMLNQTLVNVASMGIAFSIAFFYSWKMTLALLATSPLMLGNAYVQAQQMEGTSSNKKINDADTTAGALLSEAIGSIRTVASFSMEKALNAAYVGFLNASQQVDVRIGLIAGVAFGLSLGLNFFNVAYLFWIGGKWTADGSITFEDFFMVVMVVLLSMFAVAMAAQSVTDGATAKRAAHRVFKIMDRVPEIDATSTAGISLKRVHGDIEFKHLQFEYPSRPDAPIYTDYNLKVRRGQTVALVGASGSGKSTAISLLERFYDPSAGVVTLDGTDLRQINLRWLRDHVSLVSQEPVLFSGTIAENIALGKPGATREEVIDATKKANAYDFIRNFPNGLDTDVGDRGAQVSGGQKQRIAIARAILRDPEVLLLDEATSALDNESERVVQASLDHLLTLKQRTTIIVAHRLSTIRNADLIAVTKDGAIVEQGTHEQLMAIPNGVYTALAKRQVGV